MSGRPRVVSVVRPVAIGGVTRWSQAMATHDPLWTDIPLGCGPDGAPILPGYASAPLSERILALDALMNRRACEIVIPGDAPEACVASALRPGRRCVIAAHGQDHTWMEFADACAPLASAWAPVSEQVADALDPWFDPWLTRSIIPCGVEIPAQPAAPAPSASTVRRHVRLLWAGRVEDRHKRAMDIPFLLDALDATGLEAALTVVGDGPALEGLRAAMRERIDSGQVTLAGRVEPAQMGGQYARADALVMTSSREGMPLVAMEALAHGLPVFATDGCGGLPALLAREGAPRAPGCVTPVGDMPAMARAIRSCAKRLGAMGESARALAQTHCSIEASRRRWDDLLRSTLASPPRFCGWPALLEAIEACGRWNDSCVRRIVDAASLHWRIEAPWSIGRPMRPPVSARLLADTLDALRSPGGMRIALAGAGAHTRALAPWLMRLKPGVRPVAILDDHARSAGVPDEIGAIPVLAPGEHDPGAIDAIVIASDAHERALVARARAWAPGAWIIPLYEAHGRHRPLAQATPWRWSRPHARRTA